MSKVLRVSVMWAIFYVVGFVLSITTRTLLDLVLPGHHVRWAYDLHRATWEGAEMVLFTCGLAWWRRRGYSIRAI